MTVHARAIALTVGWPVGIVALVLAGRWISPRFENATPFFFLVVGILMATTKCPNCGRNVYLRTVSLGSADIPIAWPFVARKCNSCGARLDEVSLSTESDSIRR